MRALLWARLAVMLVFLVNGTGIGLWGGHIAWVQARHGLDYRQLALPLLAMAVGAILAMSAAGWLTAHFGSRRCVLAAGALFALFLPLPFLAPGLGTLVAAGFLLGAANGVMDVAMNAHGAAVERARGLPSMSIFHAFFSLGGLAGSSLAALLLRLGIRPEAGVPAVAGVLVAAVALAARGLLREVHDEGGAAGFVLPGRAALLVGLLAALAMLTEGSSLDWLGVYLARDLGTALDTAALAFATLAGAMTLCRLVGDRVIGRLGDAGVLRGSAGLAALGLLLVIAAPAVPVVLLGAALIGLGVANLIPILFRAASRVKGVAPGQGLASVAMLGYGGFLAGPPVVGAAAEAVGLRWAFACLLLAMLVIAAAAGRLPSGRAAAREAEAAAGE